MSEMTRFLLMAVFLAVLSVSAHGEKPPSAKKTGYEGNFASYFNQDSDLVGVEITAIAPGFGTLGVPFSENEGRTGFPGSIDPNFDRLAWRSDAPEVFDHLLEKYKNVEWLVYCGNGFNDEEKQRTLELISRIRKLKRLKNIKLIDTYIDSKTLSELVGAMTVEFFSVENCRIDNVYLASGSIIFAKHSGLASYKTERLTDFQVTER